MNYNNKKLKLFLFSILLSFMFISNNIQAQVNTETLISQNSDSYFSSTADLNSSIIRGNSNLSQTNLGFAVLLGTHISGEESSISGVRFVNHFNLSITRSDGNDINNKKFFHTRFMKSFKEAESFVHEYFYQYQDNAINNIKRRDLFGFNVRKYLFLKHKANLSLGLGSFYEKEFSIFNVNVNTFRTNLFLSTSIEEKHKIYTAVVYLQNNITNPKDFRTLIELSGGLPLLVKDNSNIAFITSNIRISLTYRYDSMPFKEVNEHDLILMINLVGTLKMI